MVWFGFGFGCWYFIREIETKARERVGRSNVQLRWSASCVKNIYRDWTPKNSCSFTYECIE